MSFKRDSIDTALLRNLKFRRVSEILAQQIPEDEARLLSNGRLTCLVCLHRPIFDNVNMLSIHRKGRRHIAELSKYLLHKRDLQLRHQKSTQLKELKAHSRNPGVEIDDEKNLEPREDLDSTCSGTNQKFHPLLPSVPYSSCSKKSKNRIPLAMKRKMVLETPKISPRSSALAMDDSEASRVPSAHSEVRRYLKELQRKKPLSKVVEKLKEGYGLPSQQESSADPEKCVTIKVSEAGNIASSSHSVLTEDVGANLQHPSTLMMPGWIWRNDVEGGKWVRDPDAEFDSDEEDS